MRAFFVFTLLFFSLSFLAKAQEEVLLSGTIRGTNHEALPRALVVVEGTSTGTMADAEGHYKLKLAPGRHKISVSAIGYKLQQIDMTIATDLSRDFMLEKQLVDLGAVNVYGKSKSQHMRESAYSVNAIEVGNLTGSLYNLNTSLGKSSGVRIREDGGMGSDFDLSINGLSGNAVRYFIDGVPLSVMGGGLKLASLPVSIVERIEVYKGVVPARLGGDALGGAINIITRKDVENYLDVSYGFGSFGTHRADLNARYQHPRSGLFIKPSFGLNYSRNDYLMKGVEVWKPSASAFERVDLKRFHDDYFSFFSQFSVGVSDRKWADQLSLTSSYFFVDNELQTGSVQRVVYGMVTQSTESAGIAARYRKKDLFTEGLSASLSLSHTWDEAIVVDTAYRKYRWDGSYIESSRNEISGRGKSIRHLKRPLTIARLNLDYGRKQHHFFNLNYLWHQLLNDRYDELDTELEPSKDVFGKHIIGLTYQQRFWNDRLHNGVFMKNYLSFLQIAQTDLSWITGSDEAETSSFSSRHGYGLSSRLRLAEQFAVKASYEYGIRLPLARELLGNGTSIYPNFRLVPENSHNANLGLFGSFDFRSGQHLFYEAGGFYRRVEDYIHLVLSESEGQSQYANVSKVQVRGIEAEIRYDDGLRFQVLANLSYLNERNRTRFQPNGKPEMTYNNRMPNRPWFYGNLDVTYSIGELFGRKDQQLKAAYSFQYVHWFYLSWEGYGSLSSKSIIPSQYLHSLQITYSLKKERYTISLECRNLFNQTIYDNYLMQKPGRSFFCKFRMFLH
ncbi:MAG: TonB-dependent receptor [Bacteroidetes bacterium]|nr:MAG: TonB-dependent receptor [Bacteroidota bacterium]